MDDAMQHEAAGTVQVQNEESPAQMALRTPVILSHIMRNLDEETLLTCSLVKKDWLCEARTTLKNHRKLLAVIQGPDPCVHLKDFDGTISRTPNHTGIPFSGLKIFAPYSHSAHSNCVGYQDPESYYPYILSRLTLKHLDIFWHGDHPRPKKSCVAVWFLRKLFASPYSRQIETLIIGIVPYWMDLYSPLVLPSAHLSQELLPNLRSLQLYNANWDVTTDADPYIDLRILQGAPRLEKLVMLVDGASAGAVPPDKLKCIVNLRFDPDPTEEEPGEELDWLEKVALSGATLQWLQVWSVYLEDNHREFPTPRYWQIFRLLLENSKDTLLTFSADLGVLLKLTTLYPLTCLRNLEMLHVGIDMTNYNHVQFGLLGSIYFEEMFPNLKRLRFFTNPCITLELLCHMVGKETLEGMLQQERYLSHYFTEELAVTREVLTDQNAVLFKRMFPDVEGLSCSLRDANGLSAPYGKLWTLWPNLKSLSIELSVLAWQPQHPLIPSVTFNLDSSFCGIHSEEAAELQLKDPKFLDKVQIVPTKPAITCLRNLEKLTISVRFCGPDEPPLNDVERSLFSKVTNFLAFNRMPGFRRFGNPREGH